MCSQFFNMSIQGVHTCDRILVSHCPQLSRQAVLAWSIALIFASLRRIRNQDSFCFLDIKPSCSTSIKTNFTGRTKTNKKTWCLYSRHERWKKRGLWLAWKNTDSKRWCRLFTKKKDDADLNHAINEAPFRLYSWKL